MRAMRSGAAGLGLLLLTACGAPGSGTALPASPAPAASPTVEASATPAPPTAPPPGPTTPAWTPSPSPTPRSSSDASLRRGATGPQVLAWQRDLDALGYWLGPADGTFGALTEQATFAPQKAAGLRRDGVVGPATRRALSDGIRPTPRSSSGRVVEVDLTRQLLLLVQDGSLLATLNTSTGSGRPYVEKGVSGIAVTPRGWFRVTRQIDGMRESPLGLLWRPKYFSGGYAVHGAPEVPPWPASHGCVRVSFAAMDWIWAQGLVPIGTAVWLR